MIFSVTKFSCSRRTYDKAADVVMKTRGKPDIAMMWNSSLHLLRTRDFKRGWECWELGFAKEVGTMGRNLIPQVSSTTGGPK